jgi:hypothetical protein
MIAAGVTALLACEVGAASEGEIVSQVFEAMISAARDANGSLSHGDNAAGLTLGIEDVVAAQRALRQERGAAPARIPVATFVGLLAKDIELLRDMGRSDEDISAIVEGAIRSSAEAIRTALSHR